MSANSRLSASHKPGGTRKQMLTRVLAIARVTFQEIVRDRILYHGLIIAAFLLGIAYLASQLTFTRQARLVIDFGFSALQISCDLIAILISAAALGRELERRTAFLILSKPLYRAEFLIGKWIGIAGIIVANAAVLSAAYLGILTVIGGVVSKTLVMGILFAVTEALILSSIALWFSVFSTASLSIAMTIGMYLIGTNVSQFRFLATRAEMPIQRAALEWVGTVFPNLEHFHIGTKITYGLPLTTYQWVGSLGYGVLVTTFFLGLACILFERKDL